MKIRLAFLLLCCVAPLLLCITSCSSGLKAYEQGNYYDASVKAAERLRSDPSNGKARAALERAYPMAVADAERRAEIATGAHDMRRLETNIALYERMNALGESILHSPAALSVVPDPRFYHTELRETMDLVAYLYYDQGREALAAGTMESARAAVDFFTKTERYHPGFRDTRARLEEAIYAATLRVIVTRPRLNPIYPLNAEWFYNQLMAEINANTYRNLVRFYSPEEAKAMKMNAPHQVIVLDFVTFAVGNSHSTSDTKECVKENVVVGQTRENGVAKDVYGTVKARFTINRLEVVSAGALTIQVLDGQSSGTRVLNQKAFPGQYTWYSEWASFNGDERALSPEQIKIVGRKPMPVPPPGDLFRFFAEPLYRSAADYLSMVYSRR